jgi:protein ImuB
MGDTHFYHGQSKRARLYVCIYFPEWSIDVTRRALGARNPLLCPPAILLTSTVMNQQIVSRACRVARSRGVREMMSTSLAKALAPESTYLEPFTPVRDAQALHTLAVWCIRFSPIVGLDSELSQRLQTPERHRELAALDQQHYGITIDLTGTEKIHRDLNAFNDTVHGMLRGAARIAIAPSLGGAWALSRFGPSTPILASSFKELATHTAHLPTDALRITHATCQKLADVGVYTIGDLERLPHQVLGQRFGTQLLCRIGQLRGTVAEQISCVSPQAIFRECAVFEPPLTHRRAITAAIGHLFTKLLSSLSRRHIAAKLFFLSVSDSEHNVTHKELSLAAASGDPSHLQASISPIIESMIFCGEVTSILLEARDTSRVSPSQSILHGDDTADPDVVTRSYKELLNSCSLRLGRSRIQRAVLTPSHIPERSFCYHPEVLDSYALGAATLRERSPRYNAHSRNSSSVISPRSPYTSPTDRPPVFLSPPEPIISIAMLPDRPPSWIRWRGAKLTIIYGMGPERIAPEWWRESIQQQTLSERDYFTIQDESGRWLWVFRCLASHTWFVHGVWR